MQSFTNKIKSLSSKMKDEFRSQGYFLNSSIFGANFGSLPKVENVKPYCTSTDGMQSSCAEIKSLNSIINQT